MASKHLIIPDAQVKPGVPIDHLNWCGRYIVEKQPDTVICIGDFADMESLSSYDVGRKSFEGRRYKADIKAAHVGMETLLQPMWDYNAQQRRNGKKQYKPRLVLTLGNHENRIDRAVENDAKLEGVLSVDDLSYEKFGWEVYPFLEPVVIDGIAYCHYFVTGVMGRPVTSAAALLTKKHMSSVMGHVQQRGIAYAQRADGKQMTGIFTGSFYLHDEAYQDPQSQNHWKGIWVLHEVDDGSFDEMPVSIKYLERKYGGN